MRDFTCILLDQQYPAHQVGQFRHQLRTACGRNLNCVCNVMSMLSNFQTWPYRMCLLTFDSRIIFIHKVRLNELDRQCRLSDTYNNVVMSIILHWFVYAEAYVRCRIKKMSIQNVLMLLSASEGQF
jgi:hypothetical protein